MQQPSLFFLCHRADGVFPNHPICTGKIMETFLTCQVRISMQSETLHLIFHSEGIYSFFIGSHQFFIMRNLCCYPHLVFDLGQKLLLECYIHIHSVTYIITIRSTLVRGKRETASKDGKSV